MARLQVGMPTIEKKFFFFQMNIDSSLSRHNDQDYNSIGAFCEKFFLLSLVS
jgi:hypothetical protein